MGDVTHLHLIQEPTVAKRKHGEGSIYPRGKTWWIAYRVDGKQIQESSRSTDEDVALQLLRERLVEIGKGHGEQFLGWEFKKVANEWFNHIVAPDTLADSTITQWRGALDGHLLPLWGETYLHQMLDPTLYEDYIVAKLSGKSLKTGGPMPVGGKASTEPLSATTITHHLGVLSMIFDWAARRKRVSVNPVRLADRKLLHAAANNEVEPFEREEVQKVLAQMKKDEDRFFTLTLVALGLRIGEGMALKISAYDSKARTLEIGPTVKRKANGAQYLETRPNHLKGKTASAFRRLGLSEHYAKQLDKHIAKMKSEGRVPENGDQFIFPDTKGGLKQAGNWRRRVWNKAVVAAGLFDPETDNEADKPTPHKLRHTYASEQIAEGVPVSILCYRMGHSNAQVTLSIYTHIFKRHGQQVADQAEIYAAAGAADSDLNLVAA